MKIKNIWNHHLGDIWVFPKIMVPQNGWFIMENLIKMDDLGGKPTIFGNTHLNIWNIDSNVNGTSKWHLVMNSQLSAMGSQSRSILELFKTTRMKPSARDDGYTVVLMHHVWKHIFHMKCIHLNQIYHIQFANILYTTISHGTWKSHPKKVRGGVVYEGTWCNLWLRRAVRVCVIVPFYID